MALDPITAIANTVGGIIDKIWPDANEKEKTKLTQMQAEIGLVLAQLEINKEEAKHASVFVAGWRPYVGWICGTALGWHYLFGPIIQYATSKPLPVFDLSVLTQTLFGLLGLTVAARTYEKIKGVEGKH